MTKLSIVLPALDEATCIGTLLDRIQAVFENQRFEYEVVVVDDGSEDNTVEIVEQRACRMPVRVLRHDQNRGYGAALRTGLLHAAGTSDVIITMDADDSHDPAVIPDMVHAIEAGHDLVIASRMQDGGKVIGVPFHRRWLSDVASAFLKIVAPVAGASDFTSGYRAYRTDLLTSLTMEPGSPGLNSEDGFVAGLELLTAAHRHGARVTEVPLVLRYDRKLSRSRMNVLRTSCDYLRVLARQRRLARWGGRRTIRRSRWSVTTATVATDLAATLVAFAGTYTLYPAMRSGGLLTEPPPQSAEWFALAFAFAFLTSLVLWRGGQYRGRATVLNLRLLQASARYAVHSAALLLAFLFLAGWFATSRGLIGAAVVLSVLAILVGRRLTWSISGRLHLKHGDGRRILIYGCGETGRLLMKKIMQAPQMGARVVGFIDNLLPIGRPIRCRLDREGDSLYEVPVVGRIGDLETLVQEHDVAELLVTVPLGRTDLIDRIRMRCASLNIDVGFVPNLGDFRADQLRTEDISAVPVLRPDSGAAGRPYFFVKRLLDLALSGVVLIVTLPFWAAIALLIRVDSPGPAIFSQRRVGENGRSFEILKFRTMHVEADPYERSPLLDRDPRLTRVGRMLRRVGVDELPQLLNVIRGDMSIVGPRPEMPFIVDGYTDLERQRLEAKPGITGLWQLSPDRAQDIHSNLEYDNYYIRYRSTSLDLLIVAETVIFAVQSVFNVIAGLWAAAPTQELTEAETDATSVKAEKHPQASDQGAFVLVALDQRRRSADPASWAQLIPASLRLSRAWPVKVLVAPGNSSRFDDLLNGHARAATNGGSIPEYLEYSTGANVREALRGAKLVVTDLPHVARWAREGKKGLVSFAEGAMSVEIGNPQDSDEIEHLLKGGARLSTDHRASRAR